MTNGLNNPLYDDASNYLAAAPPHVRQIITQAFPHMATGAEVQDTPQQPQTNPISAPAPVPPASASASPGNAPAQIKPIVAPQSAPPPLVQPNAKMQADQAEYNRITAPPLQGPLAHTKADTGQSGIDQIHSAWGRVPLQILDAIGATFAPRLEAALPGTQGHHQMLVAERQGELQQDTSQMNDEQKRELEAAQTQNQEAIPALKQAQEQINQQKANDTKANNEAKNGLTGMKLEETGRHNLTSEALGLRRAGYTKDPDTGVVRPLTREERSDDENAVIDLRQAHAELAQAQQEYEQAKTSNLPEQMKIAEAKLQVAQRNASTAEKGLGLRAGNLEMRRNEFNANNLGIGPNLAPLPGTLNNEDGTPVGKNYNTNVKPTNASKNSAERGETMNGLGERIKSQLQDPEVRQYLGPMRGVISEIESKGGMLPPKIANLKNDLVSYGAFQAGLHPVKGIGALRYFEDVMGGLHQTPESLEAKLASNKETSKSVQSVGNPKLNSGKESSNKPVEVVRDPKTGKLVFKQ